MQTHSAWPIFMTGPRSQLLCKLLRWPSMGGARTQLCNWMKYGSVTLQSRNNAAGFRREVCG